MTARATPAPPADPHRVGLAEQLVQAARCVQAVQAGRSLADALPAVPPALRPGVQALAFHALRHLGTTRAVLAVLVEREPPAATRALLSVALSLLLPRPAGTTDASTDAARSAAAASAVHAPGGTEPDDEGERDDPSIPQYEPFTVVDQAVDASRHGRATASQAGLVNACLRRFLRERADLLATVASDWEARWNHPAWWVKRLRRDHPAHWTAVLAHGARPAPLVLRVNRTRCTPDALAQRLHAAGVATRPVGEAGLVLHRPAGAPRLPAVDALPGYAEGWFSVQDPAAQVAAPLVLQGLSPGRPLRVLDACAAPGGKTAHLLEHAACAGLSLDVLALEVDPKRAPRIAENLARLQLPPPSGADPAAPGGSAPPAPSRVRIQVADAGDRSSWSDGGLWDAVLLDAPCTASGIGRRHPDVRWLRRPTDVDRLAATQRHLLDTLWPLVAPGGRLVYCTCSVFRAEGQAQADAFLLRHTDARAAPAPGHLLPAGVGETQGMADNSAGEPDGFFYACFEKAAAH